MCLTVIKTLNFLFSDFGVKYDPNMKVSPTLPSKRHLSCWFKPSLNQRFLAVNSRKKVHATLWHKRFAALLQINHRYKVVIWGVSACPVSAVWCLIMAGVTPNWGETAYCTLGPSLMGSSCAVFGDNAASISVMHRLHNAIICVTGT